MSLCVVAAVQVELGFEPDQQAYMNGEMERGREKAVE